MKNNLLMPFKITCPRCKVRQTGFLQEVEETNNFFGWKCIVKHCGIIYPSQEVYKLIQLSVGDLFKKR